MAIDAHAMQEALLDWFGESAPRPALAQDARSLRHPRQRGHAAADTGGPRAGALRALARALAHPRGSGCGARGDVLRAWSGLGYNRRALNLQNAARRVVELGEFPATSPASSSCRDRPLHRARDRLLRLRRPRHGARHERRRVLERSLGTTEVAPPARRAWDWNQALFDLGAQVCLARVPRCERCPLAELCPSRGRMFAPLRRQSRFEGSRRQRRAALVRELADGPRSERVRSRRRRLPAGRRPGRAPRRRPARTPRGAAGTVRFHLGSAEPRPRR